MTCRPWSRAIVLMAYGNDLLRYEGLAAAGILAIRVSKTHLRRPASRSRYCFTLLETRIHAPVSCTRS